MTGIAVVKMSGSGNDFVVLGPDAAGKLEVPPAEWARSACRRALSIGADGLLIVEPESRDRIRVRFWNPDGSPAFCGNGSRCAARFAVLQGFADPSMMLLTDAGEVPARVDDERVTLSLPAPESRGVLDLRIGDESIRGRFVVAGVPHFVIVVEDLVAAPLACWGPAIRRHPRFGEAGTNVNLIARRGDGELAIRTWERGVEAETLACGSGAVAAAHAAYLDGGPATTRLVPRSGRAVEVSIEGNADQPRRADLIGDARIIFEGTVPDEGWRGI